MITAHQVALGDVALHVAESGSGRPLLLVHGFPLDHRMWEHQMAPLAASHRVVAPDLRGFGRSSVTPGVVTMEQMADDLAALLDALRIDEPVVLCGLSMGGYVAWSFFRRHARRLRGLILCDTRAAPDSPDAAHNRLAMAERVLREGTAPLVETMLPRLFGPRAAERCPAAVEAVREAILAAPPAGVAAALHGMARRSDARPLLGAIHVPALLVVGQHDAISPSAEMREMAQAMPDARLVEIADAGHLAPLEQPGDVNRAIGAFLAGLA
jgi:3-oxoadipate enol-lactonase